MTIERNQISSLLNYSPNIHNLTDIGEGSYYIGTNYTPTVVNVQRQISGIMISNVTNATVRCNSIDVLFGVDPFTSGGEIWTLRQTQRAITDNVTICIL